MSGFDPRKYHGRPLDEVLGNVNGEVRRALEEAHAVCRLCLRQKNLPAHREGHVRMRLWQVEGPSEPCSVPLTSMHSTSRRSRSRTTALGANRMRTSWARPATNRSPCWAWMRSGSGGPARRSRKMAEPAGGFAGDRPAALAGRPALLRSASSQEELTGSRLFVSSDRAPGSRSSRIDPLGSAERDENHSTGPAPSILAARRVEDLVQVQPGRATLPSNEYDRPPHPHRRRPCRRGRHRCSRQRKRERTGGCWRSCKIRRNLPSGRPQDVVASSGIVRPPGYACARRRQGASLRSAPASRG